MLVSKYGKTYDTANGSEQKSVGPPLRGRLGSQRGALVSSERWEDDGGPANDQPVTAALAAKPRWSVLSLHDLNEAIRRELEIDSAARLRRGAERAQRDAAHVVA